jgi:hypothetical protein
MMAPESSMVPESIMAPASATAPHRINVRHSALVDTWALARACDVIEVCLAEGHELLAGMKLAEAHLMAQQLLREPCGSAYEMRRRLVALEHFHELERRVEPKLVAADKALQDRRTYRHVNTNAYVRRRKTESDLEGPLMYVLDRQYRDGWRALCTWLDAQRGILQKEWFPDTALSEQFLPDAEEQRALDSARRGFDCA